MSVKFQGGGSRDWLVPCRPDGNTSKTLSSGATVIGSYRGFYEGLNVANPQPGKVYQWVANNPRSALSARQRGWHPVQKGDLESPAYELALEQDSDMPTPLDTTSAFQDVFLAWSTEENVRHIREEQMAEAESRLKGVDQRFLDGASAEEAAMARVENGRRHPTRFARREHGIQVRDGDEVVATFRPNLERE